MALGVVSSNPPPLVDILPGSSLSRAFFCPLFFGWSELARSVSFVRFMLDMNYIILDYSNHPEVAAMALSVVSSNPPPLVDICPAHH